MAYSIIVILLLVWVAGIIAGFPMGGLFMFMPVIAVLILLLRVIQLKSPVIALVQSSKKSAAERLFLPQIVYGVVLLAGIVLSLFGLNSMMQISTDMSSISNNKTALTAVWMLAGGVVGSAIGAVGLFRHFGNGRVQNSSTTS
ncbi:MAG: DUF3185 family protein [Bacteroidetes bacterium]|nr:DUF3185 family protein [Bacteroidota bacterium]